MDLRPYTFNSTAINDTTNFNSWFPFDAPAVSAANGNEIDRPDNYPVLASKTATERKPETETN